MVRVQAGWSILNGDYYSHLMSADERREYQRQYQKEYRKRKKDMGRAAGCDGAQQAIKEGLDEVART